MTFGSTVADDGSGASCRPRKSTMASVAPSARLTWFMATSIMFGRETMASSAVASVVPVTTERSARPGRVWPLRRSSPERTRGLAVPPGPGFTTRV